MRVYERPLRSDELMHFGVLGMKWGVRRYQNYDGTWKNAGKKRHIKQQESSENGETKSHTSPTTTSHSTSKTSSTSNSNEPKTTEETTADVSLKKKGLTDNQKKALIVGGAVLGTALVAYGGYRVAKAIKMDKRKWENTRLLVDAYKDANIAETNAAANVFLESGTSRFDKALNGYRDAKDRAERNTDALYNYGKVLNSKSKTKRDFYNVKPVNEISQKNAKLVKDSKLNDFSLKLGSQITPAAKNINTTKMPESSEYKHTQKILAEAKKASNDYINRASKNKKESSNQQNTAELEKFYKSISTRGREQMHKDFSAAASVKKDDFNKMMSSGDNYLERIMNSQKATTKSVNSIKADKEIEDYTNELLKRTSGYLRGK